jgi:hypothetical protein
VVDLHPTVNQFETRQFEAEQQAQLQLERDAARSPGATRIERSWRVRTRTLAIRLFGRARTDERLTPEACAEPGDS